MDRREAERRGEGSLEEGSQPIALPLLPLLSLSKGINETRPRTYDFARPLARVLGALNDLAKRAPDCLDLDQPKGPANWCLCLFRHCTAAGGRKKMGSCELLQLFLAR